MFNKVDNTLKQEINAFYGQPWRSYHNNEPTISFTMISGRGEAVDQFLNLEEAQQVVELLQSLIEQAKALPEHEVHDLTHDDTPF